jgi:high-affinity nickel-transport protein
VPATPTLALAPAAAPGSFSARDRRSIAGMGLFVLLLHVVGWGVLVFAVAPHGYQLGSTGVFGVGVGLTAYMLGVRHAFDADHIASIDNTTRKLVGEGKSAVGSGFWFSLGHSSVVFGAALLLVLGVRSVAGVVEDGDSGVGQTLGLIGTLVAGVFLLAIGLMNLVAAVG